MAGVSIFSGRPDPTWAASEAVASQLKRIFEALEEHDGPVPSAPPLGYRGAFLRDDAGREWFAYRGVVILKSPDKSEGRKDPDRQFERKLIASAPQDLIPPALLADEFK